MFDLILLGACVALASTGQILQKRGMGAHVDAVNAGSRARLPFLTAFLQWSVFAGLTCQVLLTGLWLVVLSRIDVSLAFPVLSLGYVVVVCYARLVLHEEVPARRWLGVTLIIVGIALLAGD